MRRCFAVASLQFLFVLPISLFAQQSSTAREPQAIAVLQKAVAAMGNTLPADSVATGTVTLVEGSRTEEGTIRIATRGADQTSEDITLPSGQRVVVYSNGDAKEITGSQSANPPLQLIVTDQCPDFPLPLILSTLNNPDEAFQYIGAETLNETSVQHIRLWNTFSSKPRLQKLAAFSVRDIWLDTTSGLPLKLAYSRRAGGGAVPAIPIAVSFSQYTNVNGVLYPFQVNKSYNGTPWQTISIQSVSFNTGLTDAHFVVE
jgi:hypothetical protein